MTIEPCPACDCERAPAMLAFEAMIFGALLRDELRTIEAVKRRLCFTHRTGYFQAVLDGVVRVQQANADRTIAAESSKP